MDAAYIRRKRQLLQECVLYPGLYKEVIEWFAGIIRELSLPPQQTVAQS